MYKETISLLVHSKIELQIHFNERNFSCLCDGKPIAAHEIGKTTPSCDLADLTNFQIFRIHEKFMST